MEEVERTEGAPVEPCSPTYSPSTIEALILPTIMKTYL